MLRRLLAEVQRALRTSDPASRANFLAGVIQPYAGWALRWAIEDCRARGLYWTTIAALVQRPYPTILRQLRAGGPVYAHQPAHSQRTRNFDGQTPLRRAAFSLNQRVAELVMGGDPRSVTAAHLFDPVQRLSAAQGNIDDPDPGPILEATHEVLEAARVIVGKVRSRDAMSRWERAVWDVLDELEACYERDNREIETAYQVMTKAGMLPHASA